MPITTNGHQSCQSEHPDYYTPKARHKIIKTPYTYDETKVKKFTSNTVKQPTLRGDYNAGYRPANWR